MSIQVKQTASGLSGHHPPLKIRNDSLETLQMENPIEGYHHSNTEYPEQTLATDILFSSTTHMIHSNVRGHTKVPPP